MRFEKYSFGSIRIDGVTYEHDVVIDRGQIHKRKKKPSKEFRDALGHTPLSTVEINGLWYNALRLMGSWTRIDGNEERAHYHSALADRVPESFNTRFWNERRALPST